MATASSAASNVSLKTCEIQDCERISATLCSHCKQHICRRHFNQHADQLMKQLDPLADSFNELGEKINCFSVKDYKEEIFNKLINWRDQAIQSVNDLYDLKTQKLDLLFNENEEVFSRRKDRHLEVLDVLKNEVAALVKEGDVTFEQLQILKGKFQRLKDNVNKTHNRLVFCDIKPLIVKSTLIILESASYKYTGGGTLLCRDYEMRLNDFYGNTAQKWELIYKATCDGFHGDNFHNYCDGKGPTMTIIQSKDGNYLFGGYTEISWSSDGTYKSDPAAFLFTLTNPHGIQPTKFLKNPNKGYSIVHLKEHGPGFGGVVTNKQHYKDIQIFKNANQNNNSACSFPSSYIDTTGLGGVLFTGTKNFMVEDIEVFKRLDNINEDDDD